MNNDKTGRPYHFHVQLQVGQASYYAGFDTMEEFKQGVNDLNTLINGQDAIQTAIENKPANVAQNNQIACAVCGEPAQHKQGTSKSGKPYNAIFCSSQDKSHTKWLWK